MTRPLDAAYRVAEWIAVVLGALVVAFGIASMLTGCSASQAEQLIKTVDTGSRFVRLVDPLLRGAYQLENEECLKLPTHAEAAPCVERVRERWAPILTALGDFRDAYCGALPDACKAEAP